jgi:3-dehydroquinate synthase
MSAAPGMRWQVSATRRIEYDLLNVADVFDPRSDALLSMGRVQQGRRFVVVDACVHAHHGARIRAYFAHHRVDARIITLPGGEGGKTLEAWLSVLRELDGFPIHRRDEPVIAIGGGVLTDVVGYAAASYRRGVPHIKVPTTLTGYDDAAVGIKTGINFIER